MADLNHFFFWLAKKTGIKHQIVGKAIFGLFTLETIEEYKQDLLKENTPLSTINRRLSTLRKFGQFGLKQGWLKENPADKVANVNSTQKVRCETKDEKILADFQKQLEKEKVSPITIKNYLCDLRHFLGWLEAN